MAIALGNYRRAFWRYADGLKAIRYADDDEEDAPGGTAAFALDKVCGPEAPQEEVYGLLKTVVTGATKGRNGCVFAYGQTGSGKSYSFVGYGTNKGIVPQVCATSSVMCAVYLYTSYPSHQPHTRPTARLQVLE